MVQRSMAPVPPMCRGKRGKPFRLAKDRGMPAADSFAEECFTGAYHEKGFRGMVGAVGQAGGSVTIGD